MNWGHVHLIFKRELSDQLRDRRTLFTITVLPILLYPLLGMLMLQIAQFNQEHSVRVRVIGAEHWPDEAPLVNKSKELAVLTTNPRMSRLVEFDIASWDASGEQSRQEYLDSLKTQAQEAIRSDAVDAVLIVEPDFQDRLESLISTDKKAAALNVAEGNNEPSQDDSEAAVLSTGGVQQNTEPTEIDAEGRKQSAPSGDGLHLIANLARNHSQIAHQRLNTILRQWKED